MDRKQLFDRCLSDNKIFRIIDRAVHKECLHHSKSGALERLCLNVSPHIISGAILEINFSRLMVVFNEEELGFNMLGAFGTQNMAILSQ
jgi:hypothetical protein